MNDVGKCFGVSSYALLRTHAKWENVGTKERREGSGQPLKLEERLRRPLVRII